MKRLERPNKIPWFHSIDLGQGEVTQGRGRGGAPPNYTLFGFFELLKHLDLSGARCCDVGTMDGLAAFILRVSGAAEVIACDMAPRPTFLYARQQLGLEVDYRTPVNALQLPELVGVGALDFLLLAGVLYHVYDPLAVLVACRRTLRDKGLMVLETIHVPQRPEPIMMFNPLDKTRHRVDYSHVYWRPTKSALEGMLQLAGFQVLATLTVNTRLTVLAQARRPESIEDRAALVQRAQDVHASRHYREADFQALRGEAREPARVSYLGPRGDRFLYRALYAPHVPYQPIWNVSGRERFADLLKSARLHAQVTLAGARWRHRRPPVLRTVFDDRSLRKTRRAADPSE